MIPRICGTCEYGRNDGDCAKVQEVGDGDDELYPFCGQVCGYFEMRSEQNEP